MFNLSNIFFGLFSLIILIGAQTQINYFFCFVLNIEIFWLTIFVFTQILLVISNNVVFSFVSLFLLILATAELLIIVVYITSIK